MKTLHKRAGWLWSLVAAAIISGGAASACLHYAKGTGSPPKQTSQRAVIVHADGVEHLILEADLSIAGGQKLPDAVGWVLTVPSKPVSYGADAPADFFDRAADQFRALATTEQRSLVPPTPHSGGAYGARSYGGSAHAAPIRVSYQRVGEYDVHEIEVVDRDAIEAINFWFAQNDFPVVHPSQLQFFTDRRYTFLCIRADMKNASAAGGVVKLNPFRVSFPSRDIYYPLKFTTSEEAFPLDLLVCSKQPVDLDAAREVCRQLNASHTATFTMTDGDARRKMHRSVQVDSLPDLGLPQEGLPGAGGWRMTRIFSPAVNTSANPIRKWTRDVSFPLREAVAAAAEPLQPGATSSSLTQIPAQLRGAGVLVESFGSIAPDAPPEPPAEPPTDLLPPGNREAAPSPAAGAVELRIRLTAKSVTSDGRVQPEILTQLKQFPANSRLAIDASGTPLGDLGVSQLTALPGLRELDLTGTTITYESLSFLTGARHLETLVLNLNPVGGDQLLDGLAALDSLTTLKLRQTGLTEAQLGVVARIPNLLSVDLRDNDIPADALAVLGDRKRYDSIEADADTTSLRMSYDSFQWPASGFTPWNRGKSEFVPFSEKYTVPSKPEGGFQTPGRRAFQPQSSDGFRFDSSAPPPPDEPKP